MTLPEGITWADEATFEKSSYPSFGNAAKGKIISFSEDRRTLTYEVNQPITTRSFLAASVSLGWSHGNNPLIVIGEDWDFYHDDPENRIRYKCTPTFYYQFSEPDVAAAATGYEALLPTEAGTVELHRKYGFSDDRRGRGLPMCISLVAENKGENIATIDLQEISDETVNYNGYLYLSAQQMAAAVLSANEYLETTKIEIREAVLYQGGAWESGVTHTGTDGIAQVNENLLNTYNDPNPSAKATLTLTVSRPEDASETSVRPTGLTISVNGTERAQISIEAGDDAASLGGKIDAGLRDEGYLIPTGLYRITWRATEAAGRRQIGPYSGTEQQSYLWTIGSYEATVKTDYLQGHRDIGMDSRQFMTLFPGSELQPSAKAVFTLKNDGGASYQVEEETRDRSYAHSNLLLTSRSLDSLTGQEVLSSNGQWICPGVILDYQVEYQNGNSIDYRDMPFMQTFDRNQCLLAPVTDQNAHLAGLGYPKISDTAYVGKEFKGRDYYLLIPGESEQALMGVWLGGEAGDFYVESVTLGSRAAQGDASKTVIRWYEKEIGAYQGGSDRKQYRFYTYVLAPADEKENPSAGSVVYANNYKSDRYSTRLFNDNFVSYQSEAIQKDIIINPEAAGTEAEKTSGNQRSSYIGVGADVTYRLTFDEYWIGDYTLPEGALYDLLPRTYDTFQWELGKNVEVKYALKERVPENGGNIGAYGSFETEPDFARIEKVMAPLQGQEEEVEQHKLSFGTFTIPYNRTLYIYVTLHFPQEQAVWDAYADVADVNLYNTLWKGTMKDSVSHMIARPTQAFLKTGMYGTDGDSYGYLYANSDEEDRIVKYYVAIYNHGKGYLYLNPVHIQIPEGYTLKVPPKTYSNGWPDWNMTDVSVIDQDAPAKISRVAIADVDVTYPKGEQDKREAVLDISLGSYWYNEENHYDKLVGKQFLWPGEYLAMEVRFEVAGYGDTEDAVALPAAMPVDDSHHVGRIVQVQGVDAHRSDYGNANEGIPEFWENNDTALRRGFTVPECADTGKWVASQLNLAREGAKPGVSKGAPVKVQLDTETKPYAPQEGVPLVYPIQWEAQLVNGGTNSLTEYRVKDSVQWPYVFDGEVKLTSQIRAGNDTSFTISRYVRQVMAN